MISAPVRVPSLSHTHAPHSLSLPLSLSLFRSMARSPAPSRALSLARALSVNCKHACKHKSTVSRRAHTALISPFRNPKSQIKISQWASREVSVMRHNLATDPAGKLAGVGLKFYKYTDWDYVVGEVVMNVSLLML